MKNLQLNTKRLLTVALSISMLAGFSSCDDDDDDQMPTSQNVVEVVVADDNFSILETAVVTAGLDDDLSATGPFTIFAPTDAAFGDFITENNISAADLLGNSDLANILSYHVVSGNITSANVTAGPVTALNGEIFYVSVDPNGGVWINGNTMITAVDKMASNGVIHTLDYVITPPTKSIAEIAVETSTASSPEFTQLVAALSRAGLVDAVSGGSNDNLTVFAPTDAAFENLYDALGVSGVDEIDVDLLTDVLLYHVVPARAFSQDLRDGASLPTLLEGNNLSVDLAGLSINESGLIPSMLNIHATNGVIHVIDQVIVPE
ncbi:fasciclin domain-containing protein [Algoriphagus winogradskyi]|uniref:Uncaracterized surface protein containing fasciclin (FAS1) repeats n=1 Tax=Algoriphagus winogradskyi TaxID=237017 RepID=A0ABY1NPQ7_9BACT|nr:fasciclin domain-containing protein [Algoriphagus winogradskyi]SMP14128.1 Uncaracterized surface protein containing fasciclin (FAS1) repeats [Algoriphagus winogradskyi]